MVSTAVKGVAYLASLIAWWQLCANFFAVAPADLNPPTVRASASTFEPVQVPSAAAATSARALNRPSISSSSSSSSSSSGGGGASVVANSGSLSSATTGGGGGSSSAISGSSHVPAAQTIAVTASHTIKCPAGRRPYHTILTAQGTVYNQWQARIMYHHWLKQRAIDGPCTEMSNFTRLCPSPKGEPDGVEKYIPTIFVEQLTTEVLAKYGHFGVLNRPHSVMEFFKNPALRARVVEEYVLIAETDHVLTKPMPNLATLTEAAAHAFGYMHAGAHHQKVVDLCHSGGSWRDLQPVGPSPLIIRLADLERLTPRWLEFSYKLRGDPMPATLIQDWVLEMWAYAIAAASLGVRHKIIPGFQIEPNAYARTSEGFEKDHYIFHYTYGIEYTLKGRPQGFNTIGEWSLDKRHYGGAYPPPNLDPPPEGANPSTRFLWDAWNSAILAAGDTWPKTNAMGTIGWRRESISRAEIARSPLASKVVGTRWLWAGIKYLEFRDAGELKTPWGTGKWGLAQKPKGLAACQPPNECLFADFSGGAHHVSFNLPDSFLSTRVGDGEEVKGTRAD